MSLVSLWLLRRAATAASASAAALASRRSAATAAARADNSYRSSSKGRGESSSFWIFGYGSLVWKLGDLAPFVRETRCAYVRSYKRRFWQRSWDHRGTQEQQGRVVTLVKCTTRDAVVHGKAYRIDAADKDTVYAYLNYREKGGYIAKTVDVFFGTHSQDAKASVAKADSKQPAVKSVKSTLYLTSEDSVEFTRGVETTDEIAAIIARAVGPSGRNTEYLFNLEAALSVHDPHVSTLGRKVRALLATKTTTTDSKTANK
jgi:cation transport regulator ChaC